MIRALKADGSDPILKPGSILHTDSAKAYRHVGPLRWPPAGELQADFQTKEPFLKHGYSHTNVTHKKKVRQPVVYVGPRNVRLPDGTMKRIWGGTEKVDGHWAWLRRAVGRTGLNTGKQDDEEKRIYLAKLVRVAQWRYWFLESNRFELFGRILASDTTGFLRNFVSFF